MPITIDRLGSELGFGMEFYGEENRSHSFSPRNFIESREMHGDEGASYSRKCLPLPPDI